MTEAMEDLDQLPVAKTTGALDPGLWQKLGDAKTFDELAAAWLALQGRMIAGVVEAAVLTPGETGFTAVAARPASAGASLPVRGVAELAAKEGRPVARGADGTNKQPAVALPILTDDKVAAIVVLLLSSGQGRDDLRNAIRQLQWGAAWLRDFLNASRASSGGRLLDRSRSTLDLIATVLEHERFSTAALATATELAIRFDCVRVSIGFSRRGTSKLAAISHTANFGKQMSLVRSIGNAMDEAIDQRASVLYPAPPDQPIATMAHAALARLQNDGQILTIPLFVVDAYVGAVTFERAPGQDFTADTIDVLDVVATAIGPILFEKRRNDRWIGFKLFDSLGTQVKRLIGPSYVGRKLVLVAIALVAAFFYFATDTYRVTADAEVQGSVRRAVVSSYDGYIDESTVRAGDVVKAGDVMAKLEDRDLSLERLRWVTEKAQHTLEYNQALASRQPATINITKSKIAQADAEIQLLDEQIARTQLMAPLDGLVVSGDLTQRIGGSVSRGELLFEIAPLDGYRVVMHVDERQVADLHEGGKGEVVFTSVPDEPLPVTVQKITPVAQTKNGQNLFQVEATLDRVSERLRPGMIGVAKIEIERRPLIAIWTRPLVDWFRLTLWHWMP